MCATCLLRGRENLAFTELIVRPEKMRQALGIYLLARSQLDCPGVQRSTGQDVEDGGLVVEVPAEVYQEARGIEDLEYAPPGCIRIPAHPDSEAEGNEDPTNHLADDDVESLDDQPSTPDETDENNSEWFAHIKGRVVCSINIGPRGIFEGIS